LEEPPPHTYFILVTNAADRLLPTIISRTQIVSIPLLADEVVEHHLVEKHGIDKTRAGKASQLAEGNINLALKILENAEDNNSQRFTDWMRACFKKNYGGMVTMADDYHGLDKLSQKNLMLYSLNMMRETLLSVAGANTINRTRGDELKFVQDFSKVMNINKIEESVKLFNEATYHLERNGSAKMIFLDLSIKLSQTINP
jgi:DNA polymerase-3 subunit delta'